MYLPHHLWRICVAPEMCAGSIGPGRAKFHPAELAPNRRLHIWNSSLREPNSLTAKNAGARLFFSMLAGCRKVVKKEWCVAHTGTCAARRSAPRSGKRCTPFFLFGGQPRKQPRPAPGKGATAVPGLKKQSTISAPFFRGSYAIESCQGWIPRARRTDQIFRARASTCFAASRLLLACSTAARALSVAVCMDCHCLLCSSSFIQALFCLGRKTPSRPLVTCRLHVGREPGHTSK
jgi:hypothetical protein